MIGGLNKLFKKILGDKAQKDYAEIQPTVKKINAEFAKLSALSGDELRAKSAELKQTIAAHIKPHEDEIASLNAEIDGKSLDVDAEEQIYQRIDALKEKIDEEIEVVLEEILPMAFAVVKETARRWAENKEIRVTATQMDRDIAARRDGVEIEGDQAIWHNEWNAAGTHIAWNMIHYDVQLIGGVALHRGKVAEMQTGEGKTLVSTLPVFLNALTGKGVHLVTVNDYLAKRDAEWMGPLHEFHGMTVDCVDKHQPNSDERRAAYASDICYGTNNEFGFDYLRDNMAKAPEHLVQGKLHFAIVDEVDSVLIDEARTPLIISGPTDKADDQQYNELKPKVQLLFNAQKAVVTKMLTEAKSLLNKEDANKEEKTAGGLSLFRAFRGLPKNKALIKFLSEEGRKQQLLKTEGFYLQDNSREMHKADAELFFVIEEKNNQVELTEKGIELISSNLEDDNFFIMPDVGLEMANIENSDNTEEEKLKMREILMQDSSVKSERVHTINQLLKAYALFEKDNDYVVMDNKVKIVDEQTGRMMEGRRYSDGLHQAIEAKENVKVEAATQTYSTVTLQNYFRMYHKLAGMTGTAETEAGELWDIYKLDVMIIPTNRPIARDDRQDLVYKTKREKYNAIAEDIVKLTGEGRPVLVGTTTVEVSELLSRMLDMKGIAHQVLNAKLHQREADIVAVAGQSGTVTIATNMAGRGTDIKLGEGVKEAGGLAIIGTERHDSRRVDRQLRGRAGRQGDPGASQFYVSLEDDLMRLFGSDRIAKMMDRLGLKEGEVIQHGMITKSIERAQKKVEENNFGIRKRLLEYDDVMNSQREVIYKRRKHALYGERLKLDIANMFYDLAETTIENNQAKGDYENLKLDVVMNFGIQTPFTKEQFADNAPDVLTQELYGAASNWYTVKSKATAQQAFPVIEQVFLDESNSYKMIQVPFTDGRKTLRISADLEKCYSSKGEILIDEIEKSVTLAIIDNEWKRHLRAMDDLRSNVQFASHEQKDPLLIYKFESYELFRKMVTKVNTEVAGFLVKCTLPGKPEEQRINEAHAPQRPAQRVQINKPESQNLAEQQAMRRGAAAQAAGAQPARRPQVPVTQPIRNEPKVGRNDPCPCGSGKKYKSCHGK